MKKLFTSTFLLAAVALAPISQLLAADLTVGPGGNYATIGAAIAAAASGDRIVVKPKALPYGENITVNKGLTFVSADEGTYFECSGDWTISPTATTQSITIVGLRLITGNITNNTTPTVSGSVTRCKVAIVGSVLRNGFVRLYQYGNYDLTVANDSVSNGSIWLRTGRVMGNYLGVAPNQEGIRTFDDNVASPDSVWIVGNRVRSQLTTSNWALYLSNGTQNIYCANNHIISNPINTGSDYGIYCDGWKTTSGYNAIVNNTIYSGRSTAPYPGSQYAMYFSGPQTNTQVVGNVITGATNGNGTNVAIYIPGAVNNYTLAYNHLRNLALNVIAGVSTVSNKLNSNVTVDATSGALTGGAGNNAVNAIPITEPDYIDTDLTAGDAGCYGGSNTLLNFHPFVSATPSANSARVYRLRAPRQILQGGSIQVKADGFDR